MRVQLVRCTRLLVPAQYAVVVVSASDAPQQNLHGVMATHAPAAGERGGTVLSTDDEAQFWPLGSNLKESTAPWWPVSSMMGACKLLVRFGPSRTMRVPASGRERLETCNAVLVGEPGRLITSMANEQTSD